MALDSDKVLPPIITGSPITFLLLDINLTFPETLIKINNK